MKWYNDGRHPKKCLPSIFMLEDKKKELKCKREYIKEMTGILPVIFV